MRVTGRVACVAALASLVTVMLTGNLAAQNTAPGVTLSLSKGSPITLPPGWQPVYDKTLPPRISVWKTTHASGYPSGFLIGYAEHGAARDPLPDQVAQTGERCGTPVEMKHAENTSNPAVTTIAESLRYEYDGVPFVLSYIYPAADRDPNIERILNDTCPADVPFALPPAGWARNPQSGDAGMGVEWVAPAVGAAVPAAAILLFALGSDGDEPSASDFALHTRYPQLYAMPLRFHRSTAKPMCGVPLYTAQAQRVQGNDTIRTRVALSKTHGRVYVALLININAMPAPEELAAIGSLCAQRAFPVHVLRAPAPVPSPSVSP